MWKEMASLEEAEIYETLDAYPDGLAPKQVEEFREKYGENVVTRAKEDTWLGRLRQAFVNPFTMILSALALVSLFTEVVWAEAGQKDPSAVLVITVMVLISGILRLVQETKSGRQEILMEDIVTGDIVYPAAGDKIPADVRLLETKDLFISQSSLTGESEPVEKTAEKDMREVSVLEKSCLAFMGSNVVSGSAKGIVIADDTGKTQLITKGAVEEMLSVCSFAEYHGEIVPLSGEMKETVLKGADELNRRGMRVLGLTHKTGPVCEGAFSAKDEKDMVLIGYLAFLDLPKETTKEALAALGRSGVGVKVLTGDNEKVTQCICGMVGVETEYLLLGEEIELMDDRELAERAEKVSVFAKLSLEQKARVVTALRENGHSVGYMGDGINDSAALKAADVGISVDNAVDIAKECAQVILLEKDLLVLEQGILEGRRTYANMMKYIKLTASSNFGNMFSVLAVSLFLPFLPMEAIQLLLLNLVYDISCAAIPWDRVDEEFLEKPCRWNADSIARFMFRLGPVSSVFDILTYLLMYFVICPSVLGGSYTTLDAAGRQTFMALFQTGWFLESMWSQTLVIHLIRTRRLPFVQSRASLGVTFFRSYGNRRSDACSLPSMGKRAGADAFADSILPMAIPSYRRIYGIHDGGKIFLYKKVWRTFVKELTFVEPGLYDQREKRALTDGNADGRREVQGDGEA